MTEPYYRLETLEPERSVGFLIKRCGVLMAQIAERRFESQPISFNQWIVLIRLTLTAHASPTELSEFMGHDMGALTRLVDELDHKDLVRRERSQQDRRAVEITLTPEGRRLAYAGKRFLVELLNDLVEPYSHAEIDLFISLLQRLHARMQGLAKPATAEEPAKVSRTTVKAARRKALP